MKEITNSIVKFITLIPPLNFEYVNSKAILKDKDTVLCNIHQEVSKQPKPIQLETTNNNEISNPKEKIFLSILFSQDYKIISPDLSTYKNSYKFNYSLLPIKKSNRINFTYMIIFLNSKYLLFNFEIRQDIEITDNTLYKTISISFLKKLPIGITLQIFDSEQELYTNVFKDRELIFNPPWSLGLGIEIDFNKISDKEIIFSEINEIFLNSLSSDNIFFIFKNWENQNKILKAYKQKIYDMESFIERCLINNNRFIFQYDNTIPNSFANDFMILKLRNGKIAKELNRQIIDYFNEKGKEILYSFYEKLLSYKAAGIDIQPTIPYFENNDTHRKILCKINNQYFPFINKIKRGLKIINKLLANLPIDDLLFFTDIISKEFTIPNYLLIADSNLETISKQMEHLYRQGYYKFATLIKENISQIIHKKIFILFLISPIIIIDFSSIKELIDTEEQNKEFINSILKIRASLRIFYYNTIVSFKESGVLPLQLIATQKKIEGYLLNNSLYIALMKERIFDKVITLPKGVWYSIFSDIIIQGGGRYIHKKDKDKYTLFLKVNSILPYINTTDCVSSLQPEKLTFFIFPRSSFNKNIIERYALESSAINFINHHFKISVTDTEIICEYSADKKISKGRFFNFYFVITRTIKEIFLNNKRYLFKKKDNQNFVEILLQNKNLKSIIKIKL